MRYDVGRFRRPMRRSTEGQLMSLISLGDGSTLSLDFTSGVLDSRLTFTRAANTATVINSSGLVQTVNADVPRFDHDPTTLAPRGLLIEASAINLLNYSEQFEQTSYWTSNLSGVTWPRATVVADSTTAPDGNNTADTFEEIASTTGTHRCRSNSVTKTANAVMTMSIFVKNKDRGFFGLRFANSGETNGCHLGFELSGNGTVGTGVVFGSGYGTPTGTITPVGTSGWYRVTMTASTDSTTSFQTYLQLQDSINNQSYTSGATALGVYVWGAQVEAGSGASSYIPTTNSTATRNADECQILNLTTMGFNASAGTIFVDMGARINTGSNRSYTFLPASGGNNQIFEGSGIALQVFTSGSFVAQIGSSFSAAQKIASAYAVNDYAVSVNGAAVATDTSGAVPSSLTKLTIGGSIINTAAYANGHIRVFKYWPTRLPNATLQSLAT